jgi:hypothetical protein
MIHESVHKSLHFDEPNDKPMMKALLKLRNMKLIDVEWVPGDIRYTSETPFSVKKHLNARVNDPNVDLNFPKVGEASDWASCNTNPFHSDFRSLLKEPLPLTSKDYWNNVCSLCIQTGIWGYVVRDSMDGIDIESPPVCFVGCQECVKKNQWRWGTIKINDTHIDLPCNGAHSPIEYPVVIPVSERIGEWTRELSDGRWTGYGCWGQENMNRELVRSSLNQVVISPTWSFTQDDQIIYQLPTWKHVFDQVPQRVVDLILRTTGMYKLESPGLIEIKPGQPDEICIHLETQYCEHIPLSDALELQETGEIDYENTIDTLPLDEYDSDSEDIVDSELDIKRKDNAHKGLILLEEIMENNGLLNEGTYLKLCNVFRDIHKSTNP